MARKKKTVFSKAQEKKRQGMLKALLGPFPWAKDLPPRPMPDPPLHWCKEKRGLCPACGKQIVWMMKETGEIIPLEPQRRVVVFRDKIEADSEGRLPDNLLSLWEERTGLFVVGFMMNESESKKFRTDKTLNGMVPWTVGREGHYLTCENASLFFSGQVSQPSGIFNSPKRTELTR